MITFKAQHSDQELEKWIQQDMQEWFDELLNTFRLEGRKYVDRARKRTKVGGLGFGNITWDLRSSIGMVLAYDGQIIETYFPKIHNGNGYEIGKELADRIATYSGTQQGITMVIVAGMQYAAYVEDKGFRVISYDSFQFEDDLNKLMR